MILERITDMLQMCGGDDRLFPATELYREGWLLRIVLDWFSTHGVLDHALSFSKGARWFCEAQLPSAFLPRRRKDPLGESRTHTDGIIGHFMVGQTGRTDLSLLQNASQFIVVEAKLYSRLSSGVTHARYYDQAARTVACMSETLKKARLSPAKLATLGFYVLAPQEQIDKGVFRQEMCRRSLQAKVEKRVGEYKGARDGWYDDWYDRWFQPIWEKMKIGCLSWEDLLQKIAEYDPGSANEIREFYEKCLAFNRPAGKKG